MGLTLTQALINGEPWFGYLSTEWMTYDPSQVDLLPPTGSEVSIIGGVEQMALVAWQTDTGVWDSSWAVVETSIVQARIDRWVGGDRQRRRPSWWVTDTEAIVRRLTHSL